MGGTHLGLFWMVMLYLGTTRQSKRELCSAKRKWAFSLESLDGVIEKNEGGVARLEKRGPPRGAQCCRA